MHRHTHPQPLRDYADVEETMPRHRAIEMPDRSLQKGATMRRFLIEPTNVRDDRLRLVGQDRNDCKANGGDRVGCMSADWPFELNPGGGERAAWLFSRASQP